MSSPMTLREAVEIVAKGRQEYGSDCWQREFKEKTHTERDPKRAERECFARWDHAKAILDQAAHAHMARCAHADVERLSDEFILWRAELSEFKKLRALTRGEGSEVQP